MNPSGSELYFFFSWEVFYYCFSLTTDYRCLNYLFIFSLILVCHRTSLSVAPFQTQEISWKRRKYYKAQRMEKGDIKLFSEHDMTIRFLNTQQLLLHAQDNIRSVQVNFWHRQEQVIFNSMLY